MGRIKTWQFNYDESIDNFGVIQFCTEKKEMAKALFEEWAEDNGYVINEYQVTAVYEQSDKDLYGDDYWM